jgi:hypothetical protein
VTNAREFAQLTKTLKQEVQITPKELEGVEKGNPV